MIDFLKYRKVYFFFSGILILGSLICLIAFGLKLGIDFTGGSSLEVEYSEEKPSVEDIKNKLSEFEFEDIHIQSADETGIILTIKEKNITENTKKEIIQKLGELGTIKKTPEPKFESIDPTIGKEMKGKTRIVIFLSLLAILLYVAFAFRKVSRPLSSWQYGIATLIALFHDVLIPVGIFSILGKLFGTPVTIPIVTALLTVFGYSVNDTVVVFDRIRENLFRKIGKDYRETVNKSLNQTLTRSFHTSLTTLFILTALFFFGSQSLQSFSLVMIIGILAGTYSSIFLAAPILVSWLEWSERKIASKK